MKVFSLYHHNKFVASFSSREEVVAYGKECGGDPWDYDIIEEYLNKTPYQMYTPSYTTPSQTIPCNPGVALFPGTLKTNPDAYPHIYCEGTK